MKKNGYLTRQKVRDGVYQQAATDTERQFIVDLFCIVLNDPAIMGRDTFGARRLAKILQAVGVEYDRWREALTTGAEADYYRVKMDATLGSIFGESLVPFNERYTWLPDAPTIKKKK
jgi:hypothetical protein